MTDPFLAEVSRLAWRINDPRALEHLRHENNPSPTHREQTIRERARKAGWPSAGFERSRDRTIVAMRRLEGGDFSLRARQRRYHQREVAYESRSRAGMVTTVRGGILPAETPDADGYDRDDGPTTIFDE